MKRKSFLVAAFAAAVAVSVAVGVAAGPAKADYALSPNTRWQSR
jgi:hypothetical protein